ncbi:MAG: hypothetical protein Q9162_007244 [Coniocarpon cinnabarinum]
MTDRFPSIEEIDSGAAPAAATNGSDDLLGGGGDSTDDFLSRERAALGDDADQFASPNDDPGDLKDGGAVGVNGTSHEELSFQQNFPAVDGRNENVGPGGSITGADRIGSSAPPAPSFDYEEEPQVIKDWRERRNMAIQSREEVYAQRKEETERGARQAIDDFYENYNNKKDKGIQTTRKDAEEFLNKRDDTTSGGTSWERIAKLVDVKGGKGGGAAEGKEKFRDLLKDLQKDENAPGAKGY